MPKVIRNSKGQFAGSVGTKAPRPPQPAPARPEATQARRRIPTSTRITGLGQVPAIPASEIRVGDYIVLNGPTRAKVVDIRPEKSRLVLVFQQEGRADTAERESNRDGVWAVTRDGKWAS